MSTSQDGRGARVKNPTTKLTTDNLVKPVLSSHRENIAAPEARKLAPAVSSTSHPASTSSSSTTTAPPPTPSTVDVQPPPQASTSVPATTKRSFRATVVDKEEAEESDHSSESEST